MPPDSSIRIDEEMAHFQSDVFQGDVSFPFELPVTPTLIKAVGALHLIDIVDKTLEFDCIIHTHGVNRGEGKLIIQKCNSKFYSVNLVAGLAGMSIMSKKLPEFDYGGARTIGTDTATVIAHANAQVLLNYPAADYNFPVIKNNSFYGSANTGFSGVINRWNTFTNSFQPNGQLGISEINQDVLVPQPYLLYVLKTCFAEAGIEIAGDFTQHSDIQQAMLYSNRGLDKRLPWIDVKAELSAPYTVPGLPHDMTFDTELADPYGFYDHTASLYEIQFPGKHQVTVYVIVNISGIGGVGSAIINVQKEGVTVDTWSPSSVNNGYNTWSHTFEFTADSSNAGEDITVQMIVSDTAPMSTPTVTVSTAMLTIGNAAPGIINMYDTELDVANHVPDITLGELLRRLRGAPFFLNISLDRLNRKVSLDFTANTLNSAPDEDLTGMVYPNPSTEFEPVGGYTVSMEFPSGDALTQNNFKEVPSASYLGSFATLQAAPLAIDALDQIIYVENLNVYYRSELQFGIPSWTMFTDRHYDVVLGDGSTEVKSLITPLLMREASSATIPGSGGIVPALDQKGQSPIFGNSLSTFTDTRIIIWKGMQQGVGGDVYPLATSMNMNYNGDTVGTIALRNDGADGLVAEYGTSWLEILMRGEILRGMVHFTLNQLLRFTSGKKRLMYQSYFIRKRSIVYERNIPATEVEMIKI